MKHTSFLFSEINQAKGYAIPKEPFWELWHSEKKDALIRLGFIPKPIGLQLDAPCEWIVLLPTHTTQYVSYDRN